MTRKLIEQMLDALEHSDRDDYWREQNEAITAARAYLAQTKQCGYDDTTGNCTKQNCCRAPEQSKPVAWIEHHKAGDNLNWEQYAASDTPLYTQPKAPEPPTYTSGHCKEKAKPGGCQLHNLQCGYPKCDRSKE